MYPGRIDARGTAASNQLSRMMPIEPSSGEGFDVLFN